MCLIDGRICRTQREVRMAPMGLDLHLQRRHVLSRGPDSDLNQAHLAYVARAEIKMSILSFSFVQLRGQSRLPAGPIQRCRRRFQKKPTLNASHLYKSIHITFGLELCPWRL